LLKCRIGIFSSPAIELWLTCTILRIGLGGAPAVVPSVVAPVACAGYCSRSSLTGRRRCTAEYADQDSRQGSPTLINAVSPCLMKGVLMQPAAFSGSLRQSLADTGMGVEITAPADTGVGVEVTSCPAGVCSTP